MDKQKIGRELNVEQLKAIISLMIKIDNYNYTKNPNNIEISNEYAIMQPKICITTIGLFIGESTFNLKLINPADPIIHWMSKPGWEEKEELIRILNTLSKDQKLLLIELIQLLFIGKREVDKQQVFLTNEILTRIGFNISNNEFYNIIQK